MSNSTYQLTSQLPNPLYVSNTAFSIPVELKTLVKGDTDYSNALVQVAIIGPDGSNPIVTATDGFFGPSGGFVLTADYDQTYNYTVKFDASGNYDIEITLIDVANSGNIISNYSQTAMVYASLDEANAADATAAVTKAESSKLQSDVNAAQALINNLSDNTIKTDLQTRLNVVQNIINATAAVTKAESSKLQADVDSAQTLINNLSDGTDKTSLQTRLNIVQAIITATVAVTTAESSKLQTDIIAAQISINNLPDGADKTSLQTRLNVVILDNATAAVTKAESSKLQADVDSAQTLINNLPDSTDKTSLQTRLNIVQAIITTTVAVTTAESSKLQADIDAAQALINNLSDGTDKTDLQTRLNAVIAYNTIKTEANESISAYELAMQAFSAGDIDAFKVAYANLDSKRAEAFAAYNSLPDGQDKIDLQNRYYVAENSQYAAYKMMLLGFASGNELQPVKIENIGGTEPYKITFKGLLPGNATAAYLFYPEGYLRAQTGNILYPNDIPEDILSKTPVGSDNITISNQYIQGGQFLIIYEINGNWYQFVYNVSEDGKLIIGVNQQSVSGIDSLGSTWTVSKQSLIDKIVEVQNALNSYQIGFNVGEVSQEAHDTLNTAINDAIVIRDSTDLFTITEINTAITNLNNAKNIFLASVNLVNRETITDSINEAHNLINSTIVGTEIGQVSQTEMDALTTEVAKAVIVRNDTSATQSVIDAEETLLIAAINNFKNSIVTLVSYAETKMAAYETAALDFFNQVLAKKKI